MLSPGEERGAGLSSLHSVLSALLMLSVLIPGGTLPETLRSGGCVPSALGNHWWGKTLVMPHQGWMLLYLGVVLLYEMPFTGLGSGKNREDHVSHRVRVDEAVQFPADAKRGTNKRNYAK